MERPQAAMPRRGSRVDTGVAVCLETEKRQSPWQHQRPIGQLAFRPVTERTKDDFVKLFDRPGWQKQCWCMVWRATSAEGRGRSGTALVGTPNRSK